MNGRSERIRTSDPLVPNEVRYQAALHSEFAPYTSRALDPQAIRDDFCKKL